MSVDYQSIMQRQHDLAAYRDLDPGFAPIYEACRAYTMTSTERMYDLYETVRYVVRARLPGVILETGVWRGGSMMLAAKTLLENGDDTRHLFLFDTYEGHPKPDPERDVDLNGHNAAEDWHEGWGKVDLDEVRANMASTGYPMERVHLVKGLVEDTLAQTLILSIAVARLDCDWYAPAKSAMEFCWPRLVNGGVLVADDFGRYAGQRQALDEYFAARNIAVRMSRVDYSCRTIQKVIW